ncbi:MAG: hypothetical protein GW762_02030 [Candidatus Pacebacteria bacterium]|nr:hypothetical protein [Candidatus Paceibacterota bacterium]PIR63925.1 MAG: hypothetical protein COU64_01865 [Candidatus Pacebacteria bacterium CG10_big_fil_rev_8_21_14_0_10_40_26]PIZ78424.1 MAG: hypothetical protein COY01_04160 [Candidatus Pacebacteria bacterium CG_4_10_14_0_2_um_filter_40_20]PJA69274.1 MAG: hypothetical protein CO156_00045 [Candidatus Pacebacteria bacterium CG_4_9_14_3_um_filter_40_12]PJC41957.1 MAG: hypothetical protein CO041_01600 [Candidatus Pacebacteria bacterium CG_4_9_
MKKVIFSSLFALLLLVGISASTQVSAQNLDDATIEVVDLNIDETATKEGAATISGSVASRSAEVDQEIKEKIDKDITEAKGEQTNKLVAYMDQNPPGPITWNNFMQHAMRQAVSGGVQPNVLVLLLLFPLVVTMIAASRHIVGLRGFGVYIPAVLSIALASTGVVEGLILFLAIAATAVVAKKLVRKTHLPYLPRTALMLWTVSLGIFGLMVLAPYINLVTLMSVSIFPILILVLLAENFLDAQARTKQSEALMLTLETLGLAVIASFFLRWEPLQIFAVSEPELLIIVVAFLNALIGKFVGLRLSERLRFRSIIEE